MTLSNTTHETDEPRAKRRKNDDAVAVVGMAATDEDAEEDDGAASTVDDLHAQIVAAWKDSEPEVALAVTVSVLGTQIDRLIKDGIAAFHQAESGQNEATQLREELQRKDAEISRLRAAEEKNTTALSNVLRALEQSRSAAREISAHAVAEAHLRAELSVAVAQRDEAASAAAENRRKTVLLQEEMRDLKLKLSRVTQEKLKLERDSRATLSLARSLDSQKHAAFGGGGGGEYQRQKQAELNVKIQSLSATVAEKNRQIEELQRMLTRNMSMNRLEQAARRNNNSGGGGSNKHSL